MRNYLSALMTVALLTIAVTLLTGQSSDREQITEKPGYVPLGGMVPIMHTGITDAWTPPATGVVKDGFQVANGVPFAAACILSGSTPDMTDNYLVGSNSTSGVETPATTQPASSLTFTGVAVDRIDWLKSTTIDWDHFHAQGSLRAEILASNGGIFMNLDSANFTSDWECDGNVPTSCGSGSTSVSDGAEVSGNTADPTGWDNIGAIDNYNDWSPGGTYTPTGALLGTIGDFEPDNITTVWVIRCK